MIKLKKWLWVLVVCTVVAVTHVVIVLVQYSDSEQVLSLVDSERILASFEEEISVVESRCGITIDVINRTNLDYIKEVAIPNLDNMEYKFRDLMTCLGNACAKYGPWWERSIKECPVCGN